MKEPIYFSKIEFEVVLFGKWTKRILLNIPQKELSLQVFNYRSKPARSIQGNTIHEFKGHYHSFDCNKPSMYISDQKTGFKKKQLPDVAYEKKVVFSFGINLSDEEIKELLPYCNALEFEPYRNKEMKMTDVGYAGYRDEINMYFRAISDSDIPYLELPMDLVYDEEHTWPSERLYQYLVKTYFKNNKNTRQFF